MKTAVDAIGRDKARTVNARFRAMTGHFLFEVDFCNPAAGWEKGQIEKTVQDSRPRIWQEVPTFADLAALNAWLERRCQAQRHSIRHPEQRERTIAEVWAEERPHLMQMPPPPFDGCVEDLKRVSPTCLIAFERNRYRRLHIQIGRRQRIPLDELAPRFHLIPHQRRENLVRAERVLDPHLHEPA
jgi:hypothetical protein